jgi:hypothetical protein
MACTRKYFTLASVSWLFWDDEIKGTNERRFSSRPTHISSQLLEHRTIDTPVSIKVSIRVE